MSSDVIAGVAPVVDEAQQTTAGLFSPPDSKKRMVFEDSDSELSELDEEGYALPKVVNTVVDKVVGGEEKKEEVAEEKGDTGEKKEEEAAEEKEPEVEDIGEVVPDHYADDGRVPVFKPTMHQFKDFQVYVRYPRHVGQTNALANVYADGPHQRLRYAIRNRQSNPPPRMARQPTRARRNHKDDPSARAD
jgi:hypothetical protein